MLTWTIYSVHDTTSNSREGWELLLSISTRFEMEKVRNRAIRELDAFDLDPVDKIVLAVDHHVQKWLKPAYVALCQRKDPIREEEGEKLGLDTMVKLARAREYARDPSWVPQLQIIDGQKPHAEAFQTIGWHGERVTPEKLNTARVELVVTKIFWPTWACPPSRSESPGIPPSGKARSVSSRSVSPDILVPTHSLSRSKKGKPKIKY